MKQINLGSGFWVLGFGCQVLGTRLLGSPIKVSGFERSEKN